MSVIVSYLYTGPTGVTGPAGGAVSVTGNTGPTGPTYAGSGSTGLTGVTGIAGFRGDSGATGPSGPTGIDGFTGTVGFRGPTGGTGPTGARGISGVTGNTGASGMPFVGPSATTPTSVSALIVSTAGLSTLLDDGVPQPIAFGTVAYATTNTAIINTTTANSLTINGAAGTKYQIGVNVNLNISAVTGGATIEAMQLRIMQGGTTPVATASLGAVPLSTPVELNAEATYVSPGPGTLLTAEYTVFLSGSGQTYSAFLSASPTLPFLTSMWAINLGPAYP